MSPASNWAKNRGNYRVVRHARKFTLDLIFTIKQTLRFECFCADERQRREAQKCDSRSILEVSYLDHLGLCWIHLGIVFTIIKSGHFFLK